MSRFICFEVLKCTGRTCNGDWRRRGCLVVVCIYIYLFNTLFQYVCSLILYFVTHFLSFLLICMKITLKEFFSSCVLPRGSFFTKPGMGRGARDYFGTILGPFLQLKKTWKSPNTSLFGFVLPRGSFVLPSQGWGGGGGPFWDHF